MPSRAFRLFTSPSIAASRAAAVATGVALVLSISACKPASEAPRHATAALADVEGGARLGPPPELSVTERVAPGEEPAPPVVGQVEPPERVPVEVADVVDAGPGDAVADTAPDTQPPDAAGDGGDTADTVEWTADPDRLPAEVVMALTRKVSAADREEARKLNKSGLEAQKKLVLEEAIAAYRAALERWPAAPFPRFNLACALALSKAEDEALFHLAVLSFLARTDKTSSERLDAARLDADFEALRKDIRFRALTGASDIEITWVAGRAGEDGRKEARRLVQVLRDGRWLAKATSAPWPDNAQAPSESVIRYRAGDPIAERAARALQALLVAAPQPDTAPLGWPVEEGPMPSDGPPIAVLVATPREPDPVPTPNPTPEPVPGDTTRPDDPGSPPSGDKAPDLADYLGRKLRAEARGPAGSDHHVLEFKPTGFFSWQIAQHDGTSRKRAGRWKLGATQTLELVYRETSEVPDPAGGPPRVNLEEGLKLSVPFRVDPGGLVVDGLGFR